LAKKAALDRSREGRFPDDPATFVLAALSEGAAVPLAGAVEVGGDLGAGCSVTFGGRVLGASGKNDCAGASACGACVRAGDVAGGEAAGGFMTG